MKKQEENLEKNLKGEVDKALKSSEVLKIYANAFVIATGVGDMIILFKNGDIPVAILNLSYTLSKTLAIKLGRAISDLERMTGNTIMTTDQIIKAMSKGGEE